MSNETNRTTLIPRSESSDDVPVAERKVLIVDDEPALAASIARLLQQAGLTTVMAHDGNAALEQVMGGERFAAIVTDIHMPGTTGVDLLRIVRTYDLDVPVILMTGEPEISTAVQAVELGALLYLCKPVAPDALVRAVKRALNLHEMARLKREALRLRGDASRGAADLAGLEGALDRAMRSVRLALQPIVSVRGRRIVAFEALMRSSEPALATPTDVLEAAERLDRVHELGRIVRAHAADCITKIPDHALLFVNLHPQDLLDPELADEGSPLAKLSSRVVLEITERAPLDKLHDVVARVSILRYLGFRFALDDLGSGHAGLGAFSKCEPEFLKLDMALVRNIHESPPQQRLVNGLCSLADALRSTVICEGIESREEKEVVESFGCDLMQGFGFARPAFDPPAVRWL